MGDLIITICVVVANHGQGKEETKAGYQ